MYGYFRKYLGPGTAGLACALWYVIIFIGILACSAAIPADFRYGRY